MNNENKSFPKNLSILGTGLICLDIIRGDNKVRYYNGGSCGNVTAALSFIGWNASVITRRYNDEAGSVLKANLKNIGVNQITFGGTSTITPRIIEELYLKEGTYKGHKFALACSECGKKLPKVKLIRKENLKGLSATLDGYNVFYTDRSSSGIRNINDRFIEKGAWTVYEPNSSRNIQNIFTHALQASVAKFSGEKFSLNTLDKLRKMATNSHLTLIVYTVGKDGLFFSYRKRDKNMSNWVSLGPQPVPRILDTSGAGDWCTAGMLSALVEKHPKLKRWLSKDDVISALQFGQALAAISCAFVGGQGLIHGDIEEKDIKDLLKPYGKENLVKIVPSELTKNTKGKNCPLCLCPL